ncbi:collagen binding domain-containing protein [Hoyosella subflava]|uniref:Lipoprotein n=1 Tax=Hoyosella subflava (strain DSM 45089 / JCM 17490 / NBRC 109087 / DQS3-9A1) TaxID=443218 RepID=F6EJ81_HOYSD|nr:hypothetical protein [Hoyosella subflava]AEF41313.1 hypothetical protein AS9A_2866 [Hoyosella subflava DQS3-9A1]
MSHKSWVAAAAVLPVFFLTACGADTEITSATATGATPATSEAATTTVPVNEADNAGGNAPVSPAAQEPSSPTEPVDSGSAEGNDATGTGTFIISAATESGVPIPGVSVTVTGSNHCESVEPTDFQLPTAGMPTTGGDGTAILSDLPAGCYGFGLVELPIEANPLPTSYLGTQLVAGQEKTVDLLFLDDSPAITGTFRLVDSETGDPVAGRELTVSRCTGGSGVFYTGATAADGSVAVTSSLDCVQVEGIRGRTSPCTIDEYGQHRMLRDGFDETLHVTQAGAAGSC